MSKVPERPRRVTAMTSNKKSRHFEIKYLQRSICYEVRIRDDVLARLAIFPPDEKILELWNEATGARVDNLRMSPSRPEANFFLIAPEESTHGKDRRRFLEMLEAHSTFISSECTLKDLAVAQATLSQSPLYLVSYNRHGVQCEEYMPFERAIECWIQSLRIEHLLDQCSNSKVRRCCIV